MTIRRQQEIFLKLQALCIGNIIASDGKENNHKLIVFSPMPFISMKGIFLLWKRLEKAVYCNRYYYIILLINSENELNK